MDDHEAAEVAKALSHPLRIAFLRALRVEGTLSPSTYSRASGIALGNVAYHVGALRDAAVLEVAGTVKRRGALEHYYALTGPRAGAVVSAMDLLADV
jgi:DNA-binding transcriptional ArsR family regulator